MATELYSLLVKQVFTFGKSGTGFDTEVFGVVCNLINQHPSKLVELEEFVEFLMICFFDDELGLNKDGIFLSSFTQIITMLYDSTVLEPVIRHVSNSLVLLLQNESVCFEFF